MKRQLSMHSLCFLSKQQHKKNYKFKFVTHVYIAAVVAVVFGRWPTNDKEENYENWMGMLVKKEREERKAN